jgi:hypothetical protein
MSLQCLYGEAQLRSYEHCYFQLEWAFYFHYLPLRSDNYRLACVVTLLPS